MEKKSEAYYVAVDQLGIGVYVQLDLRWVEHNFPLNSFKIKNAAQIAEIKALGLKKIRIDPARSDYAPAPFHEKVVVPVPVVPVTTVPETNYVPNQERLEFIKLQKTALDQCDKQFSKAASSLKDINANIYARPQDACAGASDLAHDILKIILSDKDVAVHLMNDKFNNEEMYYHSLNVSILAMMLAQELGMPEDDIKELGIGCLFHDIGKTQIPDRVLKTESPTRAEVNLLKQHCVYGQMIGEKLGLSAKALEVVLQHHERVDGTGYPNGLVGERISPLARVAAIVNAYDNLCSQQHSFDGLTPYEALSRMYANERKWFDATYLSVFVRCMGVFPPGTLVRLSDGVLGLVIAANSSAPLRPRVLIFDPSIPKDEAIVRDLQTLPDLSIKASLRPNEIDRSIYEYLSLRKRMAYFGDMPKSPAR